MSRLIQDQELLLRLSAGARQSARMRLNWHEIGRRTTRVYDEAIGAINPNSSQAWNTE
jgi:hypothetical protein